VHRIPRRPRPLLIVGRRAGGPDPGNHEQRSGSELAPEQPYLGRRTNDAVRSGVEGEPCEAKGRVGRRSGNAHCVEVVLRERSEDGDREQPRTARSRP